MELNLIDKVFLVSGGASGIGEAISQSLLSEGARVAVIDKNESALHNLKSQYQNQDDKLLLIGQDLKSPKNCQLAVEQVKSKFGNLNGLINNAGINDSVGLENGTPESYLASFDKNLHHYYYLAHYALPHLKNTKGTIINISSKTAITGQGGTSAYAGAKGAQLAFTREWAVELLPYQIRVNAIIPAEVMTPLYKSWISQFSEPEKKLREISSNIPLGNRFTSPQEIANMALFLLSEKSQHITGQHIYVDGGYVHLDRSLAGI